MINYYPLHFSLKATIFITIVIKEAKGKYDYVLRRRFKKDV